MPSYSQYKRQMAVLDADDSEIESWITVRGNHIPIMKGQSKGDAVRAFIEHQAGKNDVPQGTKWTPTNKKGEGTGNKPKQEKPKYDIRHGARVPDIESYINEYADRHTPNSWREEENFIAEKLKQDGLYAYGDDIKKAMKNVYGDVYEQERAEEVRLDKSKKKQYDPDFETVRKNALANGKLYGGKYTQRSKQAAYNEYKNDTSSEENQRAANKWVNSELVAKQSKPSDSMGRPPKKKYEGPTLKELENSGVDVSELRHDLNRWYYGFYVEEARKMTPQQLVDRMEHMLANSTGRVNHGEVKIQEVFPDLIEKVKGHIKNMQEGAGKPTYKILHRPESIKEFAEWHNLTEKVTKKAYEKFGDAFYKVMMKDKLAGSGLAINYEDYELADVEKWLKDHNKH